MAGGMKRSAQLRSLGSPLVASTAPKRRLTRVKTPVASTTRTPVKVVKKRKSKSPEPVEPKEYEVQCIRSHEIDNSTQKLTYQAKWLGFTEAHNTSEIESNFSTFITLYKYWSGVLNGRKNGDDTAKEYARAAMIQYEWQAECFRFYIDESMFYKNMMDSEMIRKYDWSHYTMSFPVRSKIKETAIDKYRSTLGEITRACKFYPDIQVANEHDRFMPTPLHNFLPYIVRPDMIFLEREKESDPAEFNGKHLSEENVLRALRIAKALQTKDMKPVNITQTGILTEEIRMQAVFDPNTLRADKTNIQRRPKLELCRNMDKTWALITLTKIEEGDVIMPITGEVVDISEAEKCFREEGEMVAFKHFVALPKRTNLCLDRRRRSDHSRYIEHSCDPNCEVRSVVFESNKIPQSQCIPVLYLIAKKTIPARTGLYLDYFLNVPLPDKFKADKQANDNLRSELIEKSRDHILCTCSSSNCRGLLWVEDIKGDKYNLSKKEKLKRTRIDGADVFRGLDLRSPE